jgi:hypothetical protein
MREFLKLWIAKRSITENNINKEPDKSYILEYKFTTTISTNIKNK